MRRKIGKNVPKSRGIQREACQNHGKVVRIGTFGQKKGKNVPKSPRNHKKVIQQEEKLEHSGEKRARMFQSF